MFTGLVEETGVIQAVKKLEGGREFRISAHRVCQDLRIDDSVAVNGVCLTVTDVSPDSFTASAVQEKLSESGSAPSFPDMECHPCLKTHPDSGSRPLGFPSP